ncbi:MAG TPA: hypothetical protein VGE44_14685 [Daejeonella sp.]|uniref:hypothetical protein n=1 Tax=Daejeonella sp. TaxID=2805397 RepID=UPI002ED81E91
MYTGFKSTLKRVYLLFILAGWFMIFGSATAGADEELRQLALRTQVKLNTLHNAEPESAKIRQFELLLNEEGFLRYRRTYTNGKQEYYSFNLMRIKSIDYLGNTLSGDLSIQTLEDDVIVQTFNDRSGNVDSMATHFRLPLNSVEAEDLASLHNDLLEMKRLLDRNK